MGQTGNPSNNGSSINSIGIEIKGQQILQGSQGPQHRTGPEAIEPHQGTGRQTHQARAHHKQGTGQGDRHNTWRGIEPGHDQRGEHHDHHQADHGKGHQPVDLRSALGLGVGDIQKNLAEDAHQVEGRQAMDQQHNGGEDRGLLHQPIHHQPVGPETAQG